MSIILSKKYVPFEETATNVVLRVSHDVHIITDRAFIVSGLNPFRKNGTDTIEWKWD